MKNHYESKETEIRLLPEDWDAVQLRSLFSFKNGLNKAKQYFGYGTPIVNYMDVFRGGGLHRSQIKGRVHVSKSELAAYEVKKGDVFFTRTSETVDDIGLAAAMIEDVDDAVYSGFVLRARPQDESLDDAFKAYCFSADYFRRQIVARASYTTRALINGRSLSSTVLARPPITEQRAIAETLSDIDAALNALHRLIKKKRNVKQAAMQQLLTGRTRLPEYRKTGIGYRKTDFGSVPEDWDATPIGDLFTFKNGLNKSKQFFGYGTPIVNYTDVFRNSGLRLADLDGRVDVTAQERNAYQVRKGDVFFTRTSETADEVGVASVMLDEARETVYSGFVLRGRPITQRLDDDFKVYCFSPHYFRRQVVARASYTTRALTNGRALSAAILAVPPLPEQRAIAAVLSDMDAEIDALEAQLEKMRAVKNGVTQALLTGRIRRSVAMPEPEAILEAAHG